MLGIFCKNTIIFNPSKETIIICHNGKNVQQLIEHLHFNPLFSYTQLVDLTAIDWLNKSPRFVVVYSLLSIKFNSRLRLKTNTIFNLIPTITWLYPSAGWLEREVYDEFGIIFSNHQDLRRILTDYGFEFFPLRKDFPLSGYTEVRYDEEMNNITFEPVQLSQEYRFYNFLNPWEKREK